MRHSRYLVLTGTALVSLLLLAGCSGHQGTASKGSNNTSQMIQSPSPRYVANTSNSPSAKMSNQVPTSNVSSLQFLSPQDGWIAGTQTRNGETTSFIAHTANGGHTWIDTVIRAYRPVYLHMQNSTIGWMLAAPQSSTTPTLELLKTTDGGHHWKRKFIIPKNSSMLSPEQVRAFGESARILFQKNDGWMVVLGSAYITTDGGNTWHSINLPEPAESLSVESGNAFVIGLEHIYETTSHGAWRSVYRLPVSVSQELYGQTVPMHTYVFNRIAFGTASTGYAIFTSVQSSMQGQEYLIVRTKDRGKTWNAFSGAFMQPEKWKVPETPTGSLESFAVTDQQRVYLSMSLPTPYPVVGYVDSSAKWHWISHGINAPSSWESGTARNVEWIGHKFGVLLIHRHGDVMVVTKDGGRMWTRLTPP